MINAKPSWTCLCALDVKWGIVFAYTSPCVFLTYLSWNPHYLGNVASCHVWEGFLSCRINSDTLLMLGLWAKRRPFYISMIFFSFFTYSFQQKWVQWYVRGVGIFTEYLRRSSKWDRNELPGQRLLSKSTWLLLPCPDFVWKCDVRCISPSALLLPRLHGREKEKDGYLS